jgi:malonate transporter and related proteins
MLAVLEVTAPIFALIFAGFLAPRLKLLPESGVAGINAFVFYFALPAMLFRVITQQPLSSFNSPRFILAYSLTGIIIFGYMLLVSKSVHGLKQSVVFGLNCAHGNVGYLGVALVTELALHGGLEGKGLGSSILAPIVLVIMCDILVVIVLGIAFLEWDRQQTSRQEMLMLDGDDANASNRWMLLITVPWGILKSPLVISILSGLTFSVLHEYAQVNLWQPAETFIRILAAAAGPCALFAIGASLGNSKITMDSEVVALTVVKLLIHPIVAAIILFVVFKVDKMTGAIGVLAASLPAASNTYIIAERYGARSAPLAQAMIVGTLLGVATVTFFVWALGLR